MKDVNDIKKKFSLENLNLFLKLKAYCSKKEDLKKNSKNKAKYRTKLKKLFQKACYVS